MTTEQLFTTKHFFTKEQYLQIKSAWKQAVNDDRVCSTLTEHTHWDARLRHVEPMVVQHPGWIQAEHHLLYNLIRGKEPHAGFTKLRSAYKIKQGHLINGGYVTAYTRLYNHVKSARSLVKNQATNKVGTVRLPPPIQDRLDKFLEPFAGTLTTEDLANISLPERPFPIHSHRGVGKTIAQQIIEQGADSVPDTVISMPIEGLRDLYE